VNIGYAVRAGRWNDKKRGQYRTGQDRTGKRSQKGYRLYFIAPVWGEAPVEAIYIKIVW